MNMMIRPFGFTAALPIDGLPAASLGLGGIDGFDRTVCFAISPDGSVGGGGGSMSLPNATAFPQITVSGTPASDIVDVLRAADPDVPISVTGIKNVRATACPGAPLENGHIIIAGGPELGVDITTMPADISVVPQWHANAEYGGGATGGIAQAWVNRVAQLRSEGKVQEADRFGEAVAIYNEERDAQPSHSFELGTAIVARTNIDDRAIAPPYLLHLASVPPTHLRYTTDEATQQDRVIFVSMLVRSILKRIRDDVVAHDRALQGLGRPIRVALPLLSTGPDGAVSPEECAVVLLTEIGKFCEENPGYEFVIPVHSTYGNWELAEHIGRAMEIMQGKADALKAADAIRPRTPEQILEEIIRPFLRPTPGGVKFSRDYFDEKYGEWLGRFKTKLSGDVSKPKPVVDRFTTSANRILVSSLSHYAHLKGGKIGEAGFEPAKLSDRELKRLISDESFKTRAYTIIMGKIRTTGADGRFGGDEKMDEIIASAVASVIETQSNQRYLELWNEFERKLAEQGKEIERLTSELDGEIARQAKSEAEVANARAEAARIKARLDAKQQTIDMLKKSVQEQAAEGQAQLDAAEREAQELQKELTKANREFATKERENRRLEDKISSLQTQLAASRQTSTSTSARASSFSSSWSRGG